VYNPLVTEPRLAVADQLLYLIRANADLDETLKATVSGLAACSERYHWVGIYLLEGDTLILHSEIGSPTPHRRIPLSQGLCGAAARERRTIVVDDVREDPRYLACSVDTRSEIVVPILGAGGRVVGEIDIDSDEPAAFSAEDRALLEAAAAALGERFSGGDA
jgi:L-methionine (R)-S-oxide reductase